MNKKDTVPFKCQVCSFSAPSALKLNWHMDSAHFDVKPTQSTSVSHRGHSIKSDAKNDVKWFECGVCRQRYGHPDGLRYHELKTQHSTAAAAALVKIEEEKAPADSSTEAGDSQATYQVYVENSSAEGLNETIDTEGLKQISLPRNQFGECQECAQKLAARQNRCSHCDGLYCSKCKTAHVASMKAELEKTLGEFGKGLPKLNKKIEDTFEKRKYVLDQAFNRVKNDIRSNVKRLIDELKAREERLIKTAELSMASQLKLIEMEKQTLTKDVGTIENYVQLSKKNHFKKNLGAGHDRMIETMTNKLKTFQKNIVEHAQKSPARMRFQPIKLKELSSVIKTFGNVSVQSECQSPLNSASTSVVSLSFSSAFESPIVVRGEKFRRSPLASPDTSTSWRQSSSNAHELIACFRKLDLASRE